MKKILFSLFILLAVNSQAQFIYPTESAWMFLSGIYGGNYGNLHISADGDIDTIKGNAYDFPDSLRVASAGSRYYLTGVLSGGQYDLDWRRPNKADITGLDANELLFGGSTGLVRQSDSLYVGDYLGFGVGFGTIVTEPTLSFMRVESAGSANLLLHSDLYAGIKFQQSDGLNVGWEIAYKDAVNNLEINDKSSNGSLIIDAGDIQITEGIGGTNQLNLNATGFQITGTTNISTLTASELVITDASKNLVSAAVATYPSLTELTYLKGVTSSIQTQLNAKGTGNVSKVGTPLNNQIGVWTGDGTIEGEASLTYDATAGFDLANSFDAQWSTTGSGTLITGNLSNASATGKLIDLQHDEVTKFQVTYTGSTVIGKTSVDAVHALKAGQLGVGATGDVFQMANASGNTTTFTVDGKIDLYATEVPANGEILIGDGTDMELATITEGSMIDITNAASSITVDVDINELTQETGLLDQTADFIPIYDGSETANNKTSLETLKSGYYRFRDLRYEYYNEFINAPGTTTDGNGVVALNSGAGATAGAATTTATNLVGLINLTTGTTTTGRSAVAAGSTSTALGGGSWYYEVTITAIANLSDVTNRYALLFGFFDTYTAANQTDGVYFLYDEGGVSTGSAASANWQQVTVSNSVRTFNTTATAVSTGATTLGIEINADGTLVTFYINGVATGTTHNTNIPTGTARVLGFGMFMIKSLGTTSRTCTVDYIAVEADYTTPK